MADYTSNLGMKKPSLDDDALVTDINNNMDILDAAVNGVQDGLAIVANGNTHVAISAGQFVYVRNHSTLAEGLYTASTNIAANATLSTSNLTADSAGGLNALNSKITNSILVGNSQAANSFDVDIASWDNGLWLCLNVGASGRIGALVIKRGTSDNIVFQFYEKESAEVMNWSITGTTLHVVTGSYFREVRRRLIWSL